MKTRYFVLFYGYAVNPADQGFATKKEARAEQSAVIKEEMASARRKWGAAFLFRDGDSYSIFATKDRRSAVWSAGSIVSA